MDDKHIFNFICVRPGWKISKDIIISYGSMAVDHLPSYSVIHSSISCSVNTLRPRQNGYFFPEHILKCIFLNKIFEFWSKFTEVCSQWSSWQYASIGSDNGLALNRWQATIWTNVGMVQLVWCTNAYICVTRPQWVKLLVMILISYYENY